MNDEEIRQLFERDEARPARPGYWDEIQARLETVDAERDLARLTPGAPAPEAVVEENPEMMDTDVVVLRPSTMNINDYPQNTQRALFAAAAALLVVAMVGLGLALRPSDDGTSEVASGDTTEQTNTTNSSTTSQGNDDADNGSATTATTSNTAEEGTTASTTEPTTDNDDDDTTADSEAPNPLNEAEDGLRFDFGIVERMKEVDGTVWIWFDRAGFSEEQLSGLDHQVEPRYELASDWHGGENVNTRLRTFPLADDAAILLLNPVIAEAVCAGEQSDEPFEAFTATTVLANGWQQRTVSLTFNESGEATIVRDQTGC